MHPGKMMACENWCSEASIMCLHLGFGIRHSGINKYSEGALKEERAGSPPHRHTLTGPGPQGWEALGLHLQLASPVIQS